MYICFLWISGLSNTSSTSGQNEVSWSRYRMSEDKTIPVYKGMWKNLQPADFMEENKCVSTLKDEYDNHWTVTNCRKKLPFVCKLMGAPKPHGNYPESIELLVVNLNTGCSYVDIDQRCYGCLRIFMQHIWMISNKNTHTYIKEM